MNGRLEDARDIARRIVGSTASTPTTPFDSTQIQQLTDYNMGTNIPVDQLDGLLLKCLELIDQCPSQYLPNWQLSNAEGQTTAAPICVPGSEKVYSQASLEAAST